MSDSDRLATRNTTLPKTISEQVRQLTESQVRDTLANKGLSLDGNIGALKDRLYRAELRLTGRYSTLDWNPEVDEARSVAGGTGAIKRPAGNKKGVASKAKKMDKGPGNTEYLTTESEENVASTEVDTEAENRLVEYGQSKRSNKTLRTPPRQSLSPSLEWPPSTQANVPVVPSTAVISTMVTPPGSLADVTIDSFVAPPPSTGTTSTVTTSMANTIPGTGVGTRPTTSTTFTSHNHENRPQVSLAAGNSNVPHVSFTNPTLPWNSVGQLDYTRELTDQFEEDRTRRESGGALGVQQNLANQSRLLEEQRLIEEYGRDLLNSKSDDLFNGNDESESNYERPRSPIISRTPPRSKREKKQYSSSSDSDGEMSFLKIKPRRVKKNKSAGEATANSKENRAAKQLQIWKVSFEGNGQDDPQEFLDDLKV